MLHFTAAIMVMEKFVVQNKCRTLMILNSDVTFNQYEGDFLWWERCFTYLRLGCQSLESIWHPTLRCCRLWLYRLSCCLLVLSELEICTILSNIRHTWHTLCRVLSSCTLLSSHTLPSLHVYSSSHIELSLHVLRSSHTLHSLRT